MPMSEKEYVFLSGSLDVLDPVSDNSFGVHTSWPYLERKVQTYCWKENVIKKDDKTTYTYTSVWTDQYIDSTNFRNRQYNNTKSTLQDEIFCARNVKLGNFQIDVASLASQFSKIQFKPKGLQYIYSCGDAKFAKIGDTRTSYKVLSVFNTNL